MGGHWKRLMWLRTNMWTALRSFRGSFGFQEKCTSRMFRSFLRQHRSYSKPAWKFHFSEGRRTMILSVLPDEAEARMSAWVTQTLVRIQLWLPLQEEVWVLVPRTQATLQVTSTFLGMFREKLRSVPEKSNNVPKTTKKGYNTRFRTFPRPELRTPRDAS